MPSHKSSYTFHSPKNQSTMWIFTANFTDERVLCNPTKWRNDTHAIAHSWVVSFFPDSCCVSVCVFSRLMPSSLLPPFLVPCIFPSNSFPLVQFSMYLDSFRLLARVYLLFFFFLCPGCYYLLIPVSSCSRIVLSFYYILSPDKNGDDDTVSLFRRISFVLSSTHSIFRIAKKKRKNVAATSVAGIDFIWHKIKYRLALRIYEVVGPICLIYKLICDRTQCAPFRSVPADGGENIKSTTTTKKTKRKEKSTNNSNSCVFFFFRIVSILLVAKYMRTNARTETQSMWKHICWHTRNILYIIQ